MSQPMTIRRDLLLVEPMHPAERAELRDEQVAARIERDAVRRKNESLPPLCRWDLVAADSLLRVRAHGGDYLSRLVEDRDPAGQLADDRVVPVDDDRGRQEQILRDHTDECPLERHVDDAIVCAIGRDDARRLKAGVDGELVQGVETERGLLSAE